MEIKKYYSRMELCEVETGRIVRNSDGMAVVLYSDLAALQAKHEEMFRASIAEVTGLRVRVRELEQERDRMKPFEQMFYETQTIKNKLIEDNIEAFNKLEQENAKLKAALDGGDTDRS